MAQAKTNTQETTNMNTEKDTTSPSALDAYDNAHKLIRISISCKKELPPGVTTTYVCVCNDEVGIIKRVVPIVGKAAQSTHVEQLVLNRLLDAKYVVHSNKMVKGKPKRISKTDSLYNITILDPLTEEELKLLAEKQERAMHLSEDDEDFDGEW